MDNRTANIRPLKLTRRSSILSLLAAASCGSLPSTPPALKTCASPRLSDGGLLYEDVVAYDSMGVHLTGSEVDLRTSDWLEQRASASGFTTRKQVVEIDRFVTASSSLRVADLTLSLTPQEPFVWERVLETSRLSWGDSNIEPGDIAVIKLTPDGGGTINGRSHWEKITSVADAGASAIVAITESPSGSLVIYNTPKNDDVLPVPIHLISPNDAGDLETLARQNSTAELRTEGSVTRFKAYNLLARKLGTGPRIVVSTPQSGWTHAAGERGAGVALWLSVAEFASCRPDVDWTLISTTGHEFAHAGLLQSWKAPELSHPDSVDLWIHLGANIATRALDTRSQVFELAPEADPMRQLVASPEVLDIAIDSFGRIANWTPRTTERGRIAGEATKILGRGYAPILAFFGASAVHHAKADRADIATSPAVLEPIGQSLQLFLDQFISAQVG